MKKTHIMKVHYFKLIYRCIFLITALAIYIFHRINNIYYFSELKQKPVILFVIWSIFFIEMVLRFFPSKFESMGCQKQFKKNYKPINIDEEPNKQKGLKTFLVIIFWILLNLIIGLLYFLNIIDPYILIIISLFYGVCDMICILVFCPFQTWIMKNKCCNTCRIYNYDYAMMFTPLIFIVHPFTYSLVILSMILLIKWEIIYKKYPERFVENKNDNLTCKNCKEKLCHYKKQLRYFIKNNNIISKFKKENNDGK